MPNTPAPKKPRKLHYKQVPMNQVKVDLKANPIPPAKTKQQVIAAQANQKIDVDVLTNLARLHTTNAEIAKWFGIHPATLSHSPYIEIIEKAKSETRQRLKRKAISRALDDNSDTMLIFCLKNYCGWSNNDAAKPIQSDIQPLTENEINEQIETILKKTVFTSGQ